jgi:hypothetical protein
MHKMPILILQHSDTLSGSGFCISPRLLNSGHEHAQIEVGLRWQQRQEGAQAVVKAGVHTIHAVADLSQDILGDRRGVIHLRASRTIC